ncbi:MAG TPA: sporulation protein YqfD [Firmicutes bacterium]|nr:sporulation protein YqfD [Bacillota bacterium]
MLRDGLWPYLSGYAIIKIKGRAQEKCINLACARGIRLWDIRKVSDRFLIAKVELRNLGALGPILQRVGCKAEVEMKAGLPFIIGQVLGRKGFIAGALIFAVALYVLSSFIWFVEVKGAREIPDQRILAVVAGTGIRPGVPKSAVDPRRLEQAILAEVREVSWVGVTINGTKLTVEVAEKRLAPRDDLITHIVAAKDALVEEMILLAGVPVAKAGMTVRRGDVLVRGYAVRDARDGGAVRGDRHTDGFRVVDARGIIRGRVWYEGLATVALREEILTRTGRKASGLGLRFAGHHILVGHPPADFAGYEEQRERFGFPLKIGNLRIPVEAERILWTEVRRVTKIRTRDEAEARALAMARAELGLRLPGGENPLVQREFITENKERGTVTARVIAEFIEDIGTPRKAAITESDFIAEPENGENGKGES